MKPSEDNAIASSVEVIPDACCLSMMFESLGIRTFKGGHCTT